MIDKALAEVLIGKKVLCINCKHSSCKNNTYECRHPESDAWEESYVDGSMNQINSGVWKAYCENNRVYGPCGKEGKYFEQEHDITNGDVFMDKLKSFFSCSGGMAGGC